MTNKNNWCIFRSLTVTEKEIEMAKFQINETVEITSVTGQVYQGVVSGFKKVRGNDFKFHWFVKVTFQTQAADGIFEWSEYHKPNKLNRVK